VETNEEKNGRKAFGSPEDFDCYRHGWGSAKMGRKMRRKTGGKDSVLPKTLTAGMHERK
jgi:hypothetical protein